LFTNVYAPKEKKKLHPVFVYIQGGGLNGAGNPDDGTGLVNAGEKDIVVVTFNYRVGVLGFLASKEVKLNGDLNAGNLDQRFLLKWIQEHISKVSLFLYLLNYS
jgi:carboxylesterase type B